MAKAPKDLKEKSEEPKAKTKPVLDDAPVKKFRRDAGKKEPNRELGTADTETSFAGLYYYVYFGLSF